MKKLLLIILALFLFLFVISPSQSYLSATGYCTKAGPLDTIRGDQCDNGNYDCSNPLFLNEKDCESSNVNGCYEQLNAYTPGSLLPRIEDECYPPISASPKFTNECGKIGKPCCDPTPSKNKCSEGYPQTSQLYSGCICAITNTGSNFTNTTNTNDVSGLNLSDLLNNVNPSSKVTSIGSLISKLIPYIFTIAGILLLIFFIVSGFQFIFTAGDPKKIESAKAHITTALIGFIIIFVAYWLVQILARIFNIPAITSIFS